MFPLHCNKCFRLRDNDITLELFLSTCGHVLCKQCLAENCAVCAQRFEPSAINKNMHPSMAIYFENPLKIYHRFQKVLKFHIEQEASINNYFVTEMPQIQQKYQKQHQAITKLEARMDARVQDEKSRCEKLKNYIAYYERQSLNTNPGPAIMNDSYLKPQSITNGNVIDSQRRSELASVSELSIVRGPSTPTLSVNNSSSTGTTVPFNLRNFLAHVEAE